MSLDDLKKSSFTNGLPSQKKRSLSWLLPTGLVLGFLLIFGLLFGQRLLPAVAVETAPVITIRAGESDSAPSGKTTSQSKKGSLLFQASGWAEPDPYITYVPTLINGMVKEVHALEGQTVKKGDLLATLVDEDARLELQTAERNYESLQKKIVAHCTGFDLIEKEIASNQKKIEALATLVAEARDTLTRLQKLSSGSVSQQQIVQAHLALERQIANLAEAESEIPRFKAREAQLMAEENSMEAKLTVLETARDRAQLALDRTSISAPMDGIVLHLHAAPGKKRMLAMDDPKSATIVELYDPKKLQARIDVPLNEASGLSVGQAVELVTDFLPDRTFTGNVTRITGQADLQRNTLQAKVKITNPDPRLRPEMLVRAKFFASGTSQNPTSTSSGRLSLYVPESALVSETQVWVASPDSRAQKRSIKLGKATREDHRLVLEGLRSGESVILPPHDQLEEGTRVEVSNPKQ
jgi:RND family efflux transporter MFP subunit